MSVEIYGLYDPDSDELRYVGKAKNAAERLKRHIQERGNSRPVNHWVRTLVAAGKTPKLLVLEVVPADQWEEAEKRVIAEHRKTARLLNLADGGAMPSQTAEQRRKAAKASLKAQGAKTPDKVRRFRLEFSKLHKRFQSKGDWFWAYKMRFMMKAWAADKPHWYGCWATL